MESSSVCPDRRFITGSKAKLARVRRSWRVLLPYESSVQAMSRKDSKAYKCASRDADASQACEVLLLNDLQADL